MMIKVITEKSPLYRDALDLRYELFFKGFGLPKSVTADDLEPESTHVALSKNDILLAYGRLSPLGGDTYRISQIVVHPDHRRQGYASNIVSELISQAEQAAAKKITLNSQLSVTSLYGKLGFRKTGDVYKVKLTGVEHQKMHYEVKT